MSHHILMNSVAPVIGVLTSSAVVLAPLPAVLSVRCSKNLGALNPIPFACIYVTAMASIMYAFQIKDMYLALASSVGFVAGGFYLQSTYSLARPIFQKSVDAITFIFPFCLLCTTIILLPYPSLNLTSTLGWFRVVGLVSRYASPLSTLFTVINERNAQSIHPGFAIISLINSLLWLIYGLFAVYNPFIFGPNALGAGFCTLQILCILIFGRRDVQLTDDLDSIVTCKNSSTSDPGLDP